ncbi:MAG: hypothetical protein WD231_05325 [Candidatus Woykebacteria bacterium]
MLWSSGNKSAYPYVFTSETAVNLTPRAESRYSKQTLDFEKNENIISAKIVEELVAKLNANKVSNVLPGDMKKRG